jgi:hypothetical protein
MNIKKSKTMTYFAIFGSGYGTLFVAWQWPSSEAKGFVLKSASSKQPVLADTVEHLTFFNAVFSGLRNSMVAQPSP